MRVPPRRPLRVLALATLAAGLASCAGGGGASDRRAPVSDIEPPPAPPVSPIAPGLNVGVEAATWRAADNGSLGGAIADVLGATPAEPMGDPAALARWRGLGLRIVLVPNERLIDVLEAAPPATGLERDWLGASGGWLVLHQPEATPEEEPSPTRFTARPIRPSQTALLARAWIAPGPRGSLARLQLAVQTLDGPAAPEPLSLDAPTLPSPVDRGDLAPGSFLSVAIPPGQVAIITHERPGVAWRPTPAPGATITPESLGPADTDPPPTYGPDVAPAALPGELLFRVKPTRAVPLAMRDFIALIPRFPPEFRLLNDR